MRGPRKKGMTGSFLQTGKRADHYILISAASNFNIITLPQLKDQCETEDLYDKTEDLELNIEQPGAHRLRRRRRSPQGEHASFGLPDAGRRARRARRTRHVRRGCPLLSTF